MRISFSVREAGLTASFSIGEPDAHRGEHPSCQFLLRGELAQIGERILDFAEGAEDGLRPFGTRAINTRAGNL
jgi:hypothetical protein